jgi:hypothetical protein
MKEVNSMRLGVIRNFIVLTLLILVVGCNQRNTQEDFSTWDKSKVYKFLTEVHEYVRAIPVETTSKEVIIEKYERYFSPELSNKIFESLYVKTGNSWRVPDGDGGYIFIVPNEEYEGNAVSIEFNKDFIRIRETYEMGMYSAIEYTIRYVDKPMITDWKIE